MEMKMKYIVTLFMILIFTTMYTVSLDQWQNIRFSSLQPQNHVLMRTNINETNITDNKMLRFDGANVLEQDMVSNTPGVYEQILPTTGGRVNYGFKKSVNNQPYSVVPLPFSGTGLPSLSQLTRVANDPANDQSTNYLDIVAEYVTFSDTKLYAAIQNRGGGFPTSQYLWGPYFSYAVAFGDPTIDMNSPNAVAWAMQYVSVPAFFSTGLYKITGTTINDITRIGNISTQIVSGSNALIMSCNLSQLTGDPDFMAWFNSETSLIGQISLTTKVSLPATVTEMDYTNGGYVFLKNLFVDPAPPGSLAVTNPELVITPDDIYYKASYNGPADVFPYGLYFVTEAQDVYEMAGVSPYFTGNPLMSRTANLINVIPEADNTWGHAWMLTYYDLVNQEYQPHFEPSTPLYFSYIRGLNSPDNADAEQIRNNIVLSWDQANTPDGLPVSATYRIEASSTQDFSQFTVLGTTSDTTFSLPVSGSIDARFFRIIADKQIP